MKNMTELVVPIIAAKTGQDEVEVMKELKKVYDGNIQLPCLGNPISDFCLELSHYFKNDKTIFFKPNEGNIVEHTTYYDVMLRRDVVGFKQVSAKRMLNIIEGKIKTFVWVENKNREIERKEKSLNENTCSILLENSNFTEALCKVNRQLNYPLLFLDANNKLIIPSGGYDERFQAYFTEDTPEVIFISVDEAKAIVKDLFSEFCFKDDQDRTNALAYLITPACRGLYKRVTARTPIFLIMANRERAGKDYLAGCVGIVYEGRAVDDSPICTGERGSHDNEELRKKVTSLIKQGRRRIHSSNNRGHIQNAVLEQLATSEVWADRELGRNKMVILDNELEVSLSGNYGISYTPDFWHRARPINLFFSDEDPNSRKFKRPDLWGYISSNRALILSAIYTLINSWVNAGLPTPKECSFTSFPEWARVVGGVMVFHNLGNPCASIIDQNITGDRETKDFKLLFELMYAEGQKVRGGFTPKQIMEQITKVQGDEGIFLGYDFEDVKFKTKFGILIQKYAGREFSNIVMQPIDSTTRAARRKYTFEKKHFEQENGGNHGNVGNPSPPSLCEFGNEIIKSSSANPTNPTNPTKKFIPALPPLTGMCHICRQHSRLTHTTPDSDVGIFCQPCAEVSE